MDDVLFVYVRERVYVWVCEREREREKERERVCVYVCVYVCVCKCVCVVFYVCVFVCACVRAHALAQAFNICLYRFRTSHTHTYAHTYTHIHTHHTHNTHTHTHIVSTWMSRVNESCQKGMLRKSIFHVTQINLSLHTYEWVMPHIEWVMSMSHVTHMNKSCPAYHFHKRATKYGSLLRKMTYQDKGSYESSPPCISQTLEWVMSHIWMSRVTYVNESRQWVMSHIYKVMSDTSMNHVNASCHAHESVMTSQQFPNRHEWVT